MSQKNNEVTPFSIIMSALAGLIGIQSQENHERDFNSGKFWQFFVAGIIVTVAFALIVILGVQLLMDIVTP